MKSFKALNRQMVQEGRPSQRHPLEGHEYHKKSDEALIHIAKDAHAAAEAMKSHNTTAENKYRDQANDSATVRYFRKKNGMPEWYKKKYGHVKEGVVEEGENNQVKDGDPCWTGYQMVGMKNKGGKKVPNCVPVKEAKEKTEYDYEGDMARGQLQSIINNAQRVHDMLKDNDNLPEWVQSKITLAEDYISTVANYMMSELDEAMSGGYYTSFHKETGKIGYIGNKKGMINHVKSNSDHTRGYTGPNTKVGDIFGGYPKKTVKEEVEPIEELSKNTLKSYIPAAARDLSKKGINAGIDAKSGKPGVTKEYGDHFEKRYKGIIKATRKLAKEGVVNEVMDEPNYSLSIQARQKKADVSKKNDATTSAEIGTPAQLSLKVAPKKLETPVYESRQLEIVREALADAKKKDAAKKKEKKVNPAGDDKFNSEPELTSSITKNT